MKRIAIIALLALCVAAIPVSHQVLANGNSNKVAVCHFPDGKDVGIVIEVSSNGSAVEKHVTLHGDSTKFKPTKDGGCVGAKECDPKQEKGCQEKCTEEQRLKCEKSGGTLNEKCECIIKEEQQCTKDQIAKCNELGGVLNKNCECIIEKPKG